MRFARWLAAGLPLLMAGCDPLGLTRVCTTEARPGLGIILMDATTHGPVLSGQATITAVDGAYRDSVMFTIEPANYNLPMPLAYERAGRYVVRAQVSGYQDWEMADIRVRDGGCHVETRTMYAHLEPTG